jgi:hypothetical protein
MATTTSATTTTTRRFQSKKVKAWIAELPDPYLECRARGYHVGVQFWVEDGERDGSRVHLQHEKCACGTTRTRGINRTTGRYVGTLGYNHPAGYSAPEGLGWDSVSAEARGLYRLERIRRWYEQQRTPRFSEGR